MPGMHVVLVYQHATLCPYRSRFFSPTSLGGGLALLIFGWAAGVTSAEVPSEKVFPCGSCVFGA